MDELNPHFEVNVGSPDEVREVSLPKAQEEETTVLGLEEVLTKKDNGKSFVVSSYKCGKCGSRNDYKDTDTVCNKCGSPLKERLKTVQDIREDQVKEIIDTQVMYRCPSCGTMYPTPRVCCSKEFLIDTEEVSPGKKYGGYICLDCQRIYTKPTRCCSGKMVFGDFIPLPTQKDIDAMQSALLKPVDIAYMS